MFIILIKLGNTNQSNIIFHLIAIRMTRVIKTTDNKLRREYGKRKPLFAVGEIADSSHQYVNKYGPVVVVNAGRIC